MESLLIVEDLYAGYEGFDVLRGANLDVRPGETVAIIGPNGAGKSTLLKAVFGMIPVRRGHLRFAGESIAHLPPTIRLRRGMAFVPQGRVNFPFMSVDENLEVGGHLAEPAGREAVKARLMERFAVLGRRRHQMAGTMSGGEQQQLEMAMGLMLNPRLMLIDEPSLGLDPKNVELVFETIGRLREAGVALLIVEQNATRALRAAARAFVLEQGQTRFSGPAQAILENPEVKRLYLGG
jgi:neutral amino acid transport system ATP-binding protein